MKTITLLFFALALGVSVFAQETSAPPQNATPVAPEKSKLVVPAETVIPLVLRSTVNTRTAYVGQPIYCQTIYPITVDNRMVIPVGSSVKGAVTQVVRPGRVKGRAQIGLRFNELVLGNGTTVLLRGTLSGFGTAGKEDFSRKEGKIKGASTKGQDAEKVARTTIPGAEVGTIVGAAKGAPAKGLGIGAASGAAAGLIWVLASRGQDVVLPRGTNLDLQLTAPLTFNRAELEPPSRYDRGPRLQREAYDNDEPEN